MIWIIVALFFSIVGTLCLGTLLSFRMNAARSPQDRAAETGFLYATVALFVIALGCCIQAFYHAVVMR